MRNTRIATWEMEKYAAHDPLESLGGNFPNGPDNVFGKGAHAFPDGFPVLRCAICSSLTSKRESKAIFFISSWLIFIETHPFIIIYYKANNIYFQNIVECMSIGFLRVRVGVLQTLLHS